MYITTRRPPIPDLSRASPPLVLDLAEVDALSAAGVGELVGLHSRLQESGGRLALVNVGEMAYRALDVSGLMGLLEVRRAEDDAGESMKA